MRTFANMKSSCFFMLLIAWLLVGCNEQPSERLQMLYSLAETEPDSVLVSLRQIKPKEINGKADWNLYYLTLIKAKDKSYQSITSDSTIKDVVNYYEETANDSLLPAAYCYAGRYHFECKEFSQALDYFHKGLESIRDKNKQLTLQSLLIHQIGYVFKKQHLNTEALKYFKKSLVLYRMLNDSSGVAYGMRDVGVAYGFCGKEDSALIYCKKAYQLAVKIGDKKLAAGLSGQVARCYNEMGYFEKGKPYILYALKHKSKEREKAIYGIAANTYIGLGQLEQAKVYLQILEKHYGVEMKNFVYQYLAYLAIKQGNIKMANKYMDAYFAIYDEVRQQDEQEAIAMAKAAYDYGMIDKENAKIKIENLHQRNWLAALFLLLLAGSSAGGVYFYTNKQKRQLLHFKLQAYKEKLLVVQQKQEEQKVHANYAATREEFFPNGSRKYLSEERWKELTERIKTIEPDFKKKLTELCKMDEHSYRMCVLIRMDLNPIEIASIMCLTKSAISNQRKRLYEKAFGETGSPGDWDEIVKAI